MVDQAHEEEIAKLNHHSSQMQLAAKVIDLNLALLRPGLSDDQKRRILNLLETSESLLLE